MKANFDKEGRANNFKIDRFETYQVNNDCGVSICLKQGNQATSQDIKPTYKSTN